MPGRVGSTISPRLGLTDCGQEASLRPIRASKRSRRFNSVDSRLAMSLSDAEREALAQMFETRPNLERWRDARVLPSASPTGTGRNKRSRSSTRTLISRTPNQAADMAEDTRFELVRALTQPAFQASAIGL